jgi:hypothetical protein
VVVAIDRTTDELTEYCCRESGFPSSYKCRGRDGSDRNVVLNDFGRDSVVTGYGIGVSAKPGNLCAERRTFRYRRLCSVSPLYRGSERRSPRFRCRYDNPLGAQIIAQPDQASLGMNTLWPRR